MSTEFEGRKLGHQVCVWHNQLSGIAQPQMQTIGLCNVELHILDDSPEIILLGSAKCASAFLEG